LQPNGATYIGEMTSSNHYLREFVAVRSPAGSPEKLSSILTELKLSSAHDLFGKERVDAHDLWDART